MILQVNVAQADINIFLRTAEELQIKGLTQKEKNQDSVEEPSEVRQLDTPMRGRTEETLQIKSEPSLCHYSEDTSDKQRELIEAADHNTHIEASDGYDSTGFINEEEYQDEQGKGSVWSKRA